MTTNLQREKKVDLSTIPLHMRTDYVKRNANIDAGKKLCKRCGGTGNQLLSMWQKCEACDGKGYL